MKGHWIKKSVEYSKIMKKWQDNKKKISEKQLTNSDLFTFVLFHLLDIDMTFLSC
jgi:hypothetical protein